MYDHLSTTTQCINLAQGSCLALYLFHTHHSLKESVSGDIELKNTSLLNFSSQIAYTLQLHGIPPC